MELLPASYNTVLVVSFEAGAAQIISSLVKKYRFYKNIFFCLSPKARVIFKSKLKSIQAAELDMIQKLNPDTDLVITGRSLVPELERDAIREAKEQGIYTASFLDHWVNYEEAFIPISIRNRKLDRVQFQSFLPDEVVVGDKYALKLVRKSRIPKGKLFFIENEYFKEIKKYFRNAQKAETPAVLYISEPVFNDTNLIYGNGNYWGYNEYEIFENILEAADIFKDLGMEKIIIRLHPNEKREFYSNYLPRMKQSPLPILFSENKNIEDDILQSSLVIGVESMGMVLSLLAGKRTISYLPEKAKKKCLLPQKEILRVKSLFDLKGAL